MISVTLQRIHLVLAILAILIPPIVFVVGVHVKTQAQFSDLKLDAERTYLKKDDLAPMRSKLDKIAEDVAEIKGSLKGSRYRANSLNTNTQATNKTQGPLESTQQ